MTQLHMNSAIVKILARCFVLLLVLGTSAAASAADDGMTQPRLSTGGTMYANDWYEIIGTTNGSGNVKGVRCVATVGVTIKIYVNGGSAQSLTIDNTAWPNADSGWIPLNVRFTSSIRVRMERGAWPTTVDSAQCAVSWGFD